jgi:cytochrome c5
VIKSTLKKYTAINKPLLPKLSHNSFLSELLLTFVADNGYVARSRTLEFVTCIQTPRNKESQACRRMTIRPTVIVLLVLVLLVENSFIGSAAKSRVSASGPQNSQMSAAKAKEARKIFKQKCTKCHGQDGAGNTYGQIIGAANLTDPEWQQRVDDKRIVNSITHGRSQMPAFGEKLTEEQITSLMLYVRTLRK